jgi:hypothetical protein
MRFVKRYKWDPNETSEHTLVSEIVNDELPCGVQEQLQQQVKILTDIVGLVVSRMSEQQLVELADYFGWDKK